jgi:hypothetical protein
VAAALQVQITLPSAVFRLGVSVIVTAVPTVPEVPWTVMTPPAVTVPPDTLPVDSIEAPTLESVKVPLFWAFSDTVTFALLAASTSSETFARMV